MAALPNLAISLVANIGQFSAAINQATQVLEGMGNEMTRQGADIVNALTGQDKAAEATASQNSSLASSMGQTISSIRKTATTCVLLGTAFSIYTKAMNAATAAGCQHTVMTHVMTAAVSYCQTIFGKWTKILGLTIAAFSAMSIISGVAALFILGASEALRFDSAISRANNGLSPFQNALAELGLAFRTLGDAIGPALFDLMIIAVQALTEAISLLTQVLDGMKNVFGALGISMNSGMALIVALTTAYLGYITVVKNTIVWVNALKFVKAAYLTILTFAKSVQQGYTVAVAAHSATSKFAAVSTASLTGSISTQSIVVGTCAVAMGTLYGVMVALRTAIKQVSAAIMGTPLGIFLAVVAAAIGLFYAFGSAAEVSAEKIKALEEQTAAFSEECQKMNSLAGQITSALDSFATPEEKFAQAISRGNDMMNARGKLADELNEKMARAAELQKMLNERAVGAGGNDENGNFFKTSEVKKELEELLKQIQEGEKTQANLQEFTSEDNQKFLRSNIQSMLSQSGVEIQYSKEEIQKQKQDTIAKWRKTAEDFNLFDGADGEAFRSQLERMEAEYSDEALAAKSVAEKQKKLAERLDQTAQTYQNIADQMMTPFEKYQQQMAQLNTFISESIASGRTVDQKMISQVQSKLALDYVGSGASGGLLKSDEDPRAKFGTIASELSEKLSQGAISVDLYSKALSKASKDLATSGASGQYISKLLEGVEPFEKLQNVVNDLNSKLAAGVITAEQRDRAMELAKEDLLKEEKPEEKQRQKVDLAANQYGSVAAYKAEISGANKEQDEQKKLLTENNKQNDRANQQREEMLGWFRSQQTQRFEVFG